MSCAFHAWHLLTPTTRPQPRTGMWRKLRRRHLRPLTRMWRCTACGATTEAPVSRRHELHWRGLAKPGPLETQTTIHDALGEGSELFRVTP